MTYLYSSVIKNNIFFDQSREVVGILLTPNPNPKRVKSQTYMDPKSISVIEILPFDIGFGYFINFTKEFISIKEDSFVLMILK